MYVVFDTPPDVRSRHWLRALVRAGTPARWTGALTAATVVAEPAVQPNGGMRVRFASASRNPVSIQDAAGLIDSLPDGGATALELGAVSGPVRATSATFAASTSVRDTFALRPVLVLGGAGWESKFTIAALEERGWRVASRLRVAPAIDVTQGPLGAIDTARYSAVIALDSSAAASAAEITRYARQGGGVVLAGSAARFSSFSAVAPGAVGKRIAGIAGAVATAAPRTGLGVFPVSSMSSDAVALESRGQNVTVAARRVELGRVVQAGYDDTWRWRMAGGDEAVTAHREWWSRLVSSVAYAPLSTRASAGEVAIDETPLASLIDALGPLTSLHGSAVQPGNEKRTALLLFVLMAGSLLLEWASRRLRGAR